MPLAEFGRYTFYLSLFAFVDVLVDFGSGTVVLQHGGRDGATFRSMLGLANRSRTLLGLLSVSLMGLGIALFEGPDTPLLIASLYPLARTLETPSLVFQRAIAHGVPVTLRGVVATLRALTIVALCLRGQHHAGVLLLAYAAWSVAGYVAMNLAARRHLPARPTADDSMGLCAFLILALPLALGGIAQQTYFYVDNLFVRGLLGVEELGRYNASARLFSWIVLVAAYATGAALPWLVHQNEQGRLREATRELARYLAIAGSLLCALPFLFPEAILNIVFGTPFAETTTPLRWLLAGALCVFAGAPFLTALVAAGRSWSVAGVTAGALLVNVLGNLLWIPSEGMLGGLTGAAAATFASELFILVNSLFLLARRP